MKKDGKPLFSKPFKIFIAIIALAILIIGIVYLVKYLKGDFLKLDTLPPKTLKGKIVEIESDDTIIVEVTAERNSDLLKVGEKVKITVNYINASEIESDTAEPVDVTSQYEMQVGDIVNVSFWEDELIEKDGEKYLDNKEGGHSLGIYFSDFENREFQ